MRVDIQFSLDVDPGTWAGSDADTMTTSEVADEVRKHAESVVRALFDDQGWLLREKQCTGCGLVHAADNCSEERW